MKRRKTKTASHREMNREIKIARNEVVPLVFAAMRPIVDGFRDLAVNAFFVGRQYQLKKMILEEQRRTPRRTKKKRWR